MGFPVVVSLILIVVGLVFLVAGKAITGAWRATFHANGPSARVFYAGALILGMGLIGLVGSALSAIA
jgi:hypothetical protein